MKNLNYMSIAEDVMNKIKKGAFLTVKAGDALNTMTIGWATFGFIWQKPVMMVAVRSSRHTFGIIEKARDFTVTIPSGDMSKALAFCGSQSRRDVCEADVVCVKRDVVNFLTCRQDEKTISKLRRDDRKLLGGGQWSII